MTHHGDGVKERNCQHYDAQAHATASRRDRAKGPAVQLKKFHNALKRSLLARFARGAPALLDMCCGRGGDLQKWADVGISSVTCLDISKAELEEARRRYDALNVQKPACVFQHTTQLGCTVWKAGDFDAISCMFALHYFFESEAMLQSLLQFVALNLKKGGYFIGTVPDGQRINMELMCGEGASGATAVKLEAMWQGPPQPFGSSYSFRLVDTVVAGAFSSGDPIEYLVYENVLAKAAATVGLRPVTDYYIQGLEETTQLFKHFNPPFSGEFARASRLYAAFVFQKM